MAGVYIHIPFCARKCVYCDFYSVGARMADWPRLVSALLDEARVRVPELTGAGPKCDTLYIGGGTPSLLPPGEFGRLAAGVLSLTGPVSEFTVEVNPDDVTGELADAWRGAGVDRVSMGVQSLVDGELRAIGRRHDSRRAREAYDTLRRRFGNVSLDLMFGLPGQTRRSLRESVAGVIDMRPEHVSVYSLMYEERTALTRMRDSGRIDETPEEESAAMFADITEMLDAAGYEQYEISNYSLPGFRSRHNSAYWSGEPYVGLGPAAHSYDGLRTRRANAPDVRAYISRWLDGGGDAVTVETLTDDELREEMIMTRLRTRGGIPLEEFRRRFGAVAFRSLLSASRRWVAAGLMEERDGTLALSRRGVMVSDEIIVSLF